MKGNPSKNHIDEDVLKTFPRRLQNVFSVTFFVFEDVFKMSSRHLEDVFARRLLDDVLKLS